ncbi:hypothetical protein ILYODFUR_036940 [Ilyodon furcidens]|uniref:Uncharacterized protein n=1 Tax=Ilyodon furcidens TaxID=33524 RepID=A0ABV0UYA9_9TELE
MPLKIPGGWWGFGQRTKPAGGHRFEVGHMKGGVDPETGRETEACNRYYLIRTNKPRREFPGERLKWIVPGGQPDLLTRLIQRSQPVPPISKSFILKCSSL